MSYIVTNVLQKQNILHSYHYPTNADDPCIVTTFPQKQNTLYSYHSPTKAEYPAQLPLSYKAEHPV